MEIKSEKSEESFELFWFYNASNKLPSITSIPNPVASTVGQLVPTTGSDGCVVAVAVAVTTGQVQSVSLKHCVFLQLPVDAPEAM